MAGMECSAFSEDGKYFVYCGVDGKLKIWDTESNTLCQEYTPNLHLSSSCSCLTWVSSKNTPTPRRKKRRKSLEYDGESHAFALGTVSGNILLYDVASSNVVGSLEGGHLSAVNNVAWTRGCNLFSCDVQHIVEWNVAQQKVKSKWKAGSEKLTCLLVLPGGDSLIAAGCTISLWDVPNKQLMRRYTGHASEITSLTLILGGDNYFISTAKNDRLLNAWSLSTSSQEKNPVASFLLSEVATSVSVSSSGATSMVAVTRNGVLHLFKHQLNGRCQKPIKPKVTVQIASDSNQNKDAVQSIPIIAAHQEGSDIVIAYGSSVFLTFEIISLKDDDNVVILTRQDPRRSHVSQDTDVLKVKVPETSDGVEYVSPVGASASTPKKGRKERLEVPIEKRLDNLTVTRPESSSHEPPRADSMAHLLMQGLFSKDKKILQSVLLRKDPSLINSTVMRLNVQCTVPLLKELVSQVQGKTLASHIAVLWLKAVIRSHAGHLLANPDVKEMLAPVLGLVESRLSLLAPLSRLRGRLDLLVDQIEESSKKGDTGQDLGESLLVYQDQDSDEGSGMEEVAGSESEDHWEELSDVDTNEDIEEDEQDDVNMSS